MTAESWAPEEYMRLQEREIDELKQILRDARTWIEDPVHRLDNGYGPAGLTRNRILEAIDKAL